MAKCRCGKKAVFFRKYEGRALCKSHFLNSIETKARRTVNQGRMIKRGEKILVALSGGKDSNALLYLMNKIAGRRGVKLEAITIDEGIKGYRPDTLKAARELCKRLGIKHHVYTFKDVFNKTLDQKVKEIIKKRKGLREPCTYCGVGRRYILNKAARELKADKLCLGHNLDDEVQSIMMNYLRGDLFRAARMGPVTKLSLSKKGGEKFVPRIRPLRELPEREVALYAMLKGLPTPWDECPYTSGLRFDVRDFINDMEDKYSGIKFNILETFEKLRPGMKEIALKKEGKIVLCKNCGEAGSKDVCKACQLWR